MTKETATKPDLVPESGNRIYIINLLCTSCNRKMRYLEIEGQKLEVTIGPDHPHTIELCPGELTPCWCPDFVLDSITGMSS